MEMLIFPVCLLLIVYFWFESLRSREQVILHCTRLCRKADIQLLDQTVSLRSFSLQRFRGNLPKLVKHYHFEVSETGNDRLSGFVSIVGHTIILTHLENQDGQNVFHQNPENTKH